METKLFIKYTRRKFHSVFYRTKNKLHFSKDNSSYKLISYIDEQGNFDYEKYRGIQTAGNHKKIDVVWVSEENIRFISKWLKKNVPMITMGVCHGVRNGAEQKYFKKYLGEVNIIGTEISDTATQYSDTIQWDFHEVNPEFSKKADFVYSNSFDHSYNPAKALNAWLDALKPNYESVCIIEHSSGHTVDAVTELDPFGASLEAMPTLVKEWTNGKYEVRDILQAPDIRVSLTDDRFIIIGKVKD